ncbi:MAG: PQQ-dependent sugar dehydrogenase [Chitinophagaceae bacterium]
MNEVFLKSDLVNAAANLQDPWEITYGYDDSLWVTEATGYVVRKISPITGGMRTILDLNTFTDAASTPTTKWRKAYTVGGAVPKPQGGLMGFAFAPDFATATTKYVYLAYVHDFVGTNVAAPAPYAAETVNGDLFITWVTRWQYVNGLLKNPMAICDTIRGSSDHNSGRLIIFKDSSNAYYLMEAVGDMGAGQFANTNRVEKAQWTNSYEGKILRWNLDGTIPAGNPFGNAIFATGIRNNQGFAADTTRHLLYGASHGPFSDDEINILGWRRNYGHPLIEGMSSDNNYQNSKAATPASILPLITNEPAQALSLPYYRDPIFTAYASTQANINNIYLTNPGNGGWPSEGWSGMDLYMDSKIPGWKNALIVAGLKWGRVLKIKLDPLTGKTVIPTGATDTASYFGSHNRFRDVAFDPNGTTLYVCMERQTTSSGPSNANPLVPDCLGCIHKYTFLGYNAVGAASAIPTTIPIGRGVVNTCTNANTITIDATNNNLWVPITDDSSNVIAEIKANGNNLGVVTTSFFYKNSGFIREDGGKKLYMDRNITITPTVQPGSNVNVRLYITGAELTRMIGATNSIGQPGGYATINDVAVFKNTNPCGSTMGSSATKFTTTRAAFGTGYVLTVTIPSFSTFYFANQSLTTLPVNLISFTGSLNSATKATDLNWKTADEQNLASYIVERSTDGRTYDAIGTVTPNGSNDYNFSDRDAYSQSSLLLYYRLKMVDNDQSAKYSNVITISLTDLVGIVIATPNPTAGQTKITMTAAVDGRANWQIVDNAGRVVMKSNVQLKSGANSMPLDISKLAAGLYYLNVSGAGIDTKVKLQKL